MDVDDYKSKIRLTDNFSIIILTYNEEKNIEACLQSIVSLNAEIFIVDSGSTDGTLQICRKYTGNIYEHAFANYGDQRNWALTYLPFSSNWILNLDADHRVMPELAEELKNTFRQSIDPETNGFLVSRRTMFMGKWIKHGGHYPTYHAILFRKNFGKCEDKLYDQHFKVTGKTQLLRNDIIDIITDSLNTFISRHNHWATLEAKYHFEELNADEEKEGVVKAKLFGNPIERRRFIKKRYESFPLFVRPIIYYIIRYFIRLGFLDGPEGLIFHFLQGFWFRFLIDAKIYELKISSNKRRLDVKVKFFIVFLVLFLMFYYFNLLFFDLTNPGKYYVSFLANYLNYIQMMRWVLLNSSSKIINFMGFSAINNNYDLLVVGRGGVRVVYSCLGLGVISFFLAFVIAYPQSLKAKVLFVFSGILVIEILNVFRFVLIALLWSPKYNKLIDHHTIFNLVIYIFLAITLYFWVLNADIRYQNNDSK